MTNTMSIGQDFISELDYELPASRRLLERVPSENGQWKPHPKSSALGHLAQLVTRMPGIMADIVRGKDLDLAAGPPYSFETTETLLREYDAHVTDVRETLAQAKDDVFALSWNLRYGDHVLQDRPTKGRLAKHNQPLRASPRPTNSVLATERSADP